MAVTQAYLDYLEDLFAGFGRLRLRRMFGGAGLYLDEVFFAVVDDDLLYFKVDDTTRGDYERAGMGPFRPFPDQPDYAMGYWQVPAEVLEDRDELRAWTRSALQVALQARAKKPRKAGTKTMIGEQR